MVVANLANMGISINSAVNSGHCGRVGLNSHFNKDTGVMSALCTVDIGGAIAYMSQDLQSRDTRASISGIITAAAAMAPYGAAVHAGCAKGGVLKNPKKQVYSVPTPRRLEQLNELKDAMANLKGLRQELEAKLGFNA
eukprot:s7018_g1.t1